MITEITKDILEYHLPFAKDAKGNKIFNAYKQALEQADKLLRGKLLGRDLYDLLDEAFHPEATEEDTDPELPENEAEGNDPWVMPCTLAELQKEIERYICNVAAYKAAGKADLVQTVSGFGTVSGQQEAIASSARVESMRTDCLVASREAEDNIMKMLLGNSYTSEAAMSSKVLMGRTEYLIWTYEDLEKVAPLKGAGYMDSGSGAIALEIFHSDPWVKFGPQVGVASYKLKQKIGSELDVTINNMRAGEVSSTRSLLIELGRQYIAAYLRNDAASVAEMTNSMQMIYQLMDENPTEFVAWKSSDQKKAREIKEFTNTKDSAGFWM